MTLSTTTSRISHTGNGSTKAFAFPYKFLANSDLKVYVAGTLKTLTTHYTVTGAGLAAGGTVTFGTAPANGAVVMIVRDPPVTQTTAYSNNGPFPAASTETAFDKATMVDQRSRDMASRSLRLPDGEVDGSSSYQANNNRIANVRPGVVAGDAVTVDQLTALTSGTAVEFYSTKDVAEAATIEESVTWLRTQGDVEIGDGGAALYKKAESEPAHEGKFQSQDGAWWELADTITTLVTGGPLQAGDIGSGGVAYSQKLLRGFPEGSHSGEARTLMHIETNPVGSGINGPGSSDYAMYLSAIKQNWYDRDLAEPGEIGGLYIFGRQGGPDGNTGDEARSDMAAVLVNFVSIGKSGWMTGVEGRVTNINDDYTDRLSVSFQLGAINSQLDTESEFSFGLVLAAGVGTIDYGLYVVNNGGTFDKAVTVANANGEFYISGSGFIKFLPIAQPAAITGAMFVDINDENKLKICRNGSTFETVTTS